MEQVAGFFGPYRFLSNFWYAPVVFEGRRYRTNEHAFQAAKALSPYDRVKIQASTKPQEAKKLGREVPKRSDWENIKIDVMRDIVLDKFARNPDLAEALMETGDAELIETNTWGDRFWGQDTEGNGLNWLGTILMEVRRGLANEDVLSMTA